MKIAFIQNDKAEHHINSSRWLSHFPSAELARRGHEVHLLQDASVVAVMGTPADTVDVVIVEIPTILEIHGVFANACKARGQAVFASVDDAYHLMPVREPRSPWARREPYTAPDGGIAWKDTGLEEFYQVMEMHDGVLVPSVPLYWHWMDLNYTTYIPNRAPRHLFDEVLAEPFDPGLPPGKKGVIGWGGSIYHEFSMPHTGALEALVELSDDYKIRIVGRDGIAKKLIEMGADVEFLPFIHDYQDWLREVRTWSVGIAPLAGDYDSHRSWIKVLEYAALGVPWVATNDAPYARCKGGIAISAPTSDDWVYAIDMAFRMSSKYAVQGREWAGRQWIENGTEWNDVLRYAEIVIEERRLA